MELQKKKLKKKAYHIKEQILFGANGKTLALGEGEGFVKAICNSEDNTLLGIHIMGPHASDLIHEGVLAIDKNMKAYDIKRYSS